MHTHTFSYHKPKTIQALRYHFISRREIKIMMILVNVFAVLTAALYFFHKISPAAFLLSSLMWFLMMFMFWFFLPRIIYRRTHSFREQFSVGMNETAFTLSRDEQSRSFEWKEFSGWFESPHFFHLYFSERSFFLIPKEAFVEDQEAEARKFFTEKIKR